jgi:predicted permease
MTGTTPATRFRFWLWLIRFVGVLVPRRLRADWRAEWEAELRWREMMLAEWELLNRRNKLDLLRRSLGAFRDALALQPQRLEDEMFQDLRYGWRMLVKHKGFTVVAVISLALGIGANTALFSVVDAVLLRTLPVREPGRLVLFEWEAGDKFRTGGMRGVFMRPPAGRRRASMFRYDTYEKLRAEQSRGGQSPLSSLFAFAPLWQQTVVVNEQAEMAQVQGVSGGYFAGLGVQPAVGRAINEDDDRVGAPPVVVLSHAYWLERFGGDPAAVGRQIKINNLGFTVVGVAPEDFTGSLQVGDRPPLSVPLALEPLLLGKGTARATADHPEMWWVHLMGRLKPGATAEQARESLAGVFQAMAIEGMPPPKADRDVAKLEAKDYPQLTARSGSQGMMESRRRLSYRIYGLFIVVGVVLLIACANVANLLLARATLRAHEISLRLAVGAGRWRLIRQLMTESVLLSLLGGVAGVLFAVWGMQALTAMTDRHTDFIPPDVDLRLDWRVLGFTFAVSLLTGILFGLVPAWRATEADLTGALKQSRQSSGRVSRLGKGLVVAQVALSLLLLVGAGLYIRTLRNLQQVKLGFNQENLLLFSLDAQQGGYKDERLRQFYEQLFARLDHLPGVQSATFARVPLISHFMWNTEVLLPGETEKNTGQHSTNRQLVRENYFATMEIPLLSGRAFTARDGAQSPAVAVVNEAFARQFFPHENALGKRVTDTDSKRELEVVGVVADTKYSSQREDIEPLMYTTWRQEPEHIGAMNFALRTHGEPTQLADAVRRAVRELDAALPVTDVSTQAARSSRTLGQERLFARLLGFFGVLALALAVVGLSGVLAYSVAQRTNEIGIRMALGAETRDVLRMVVWQGMRLVLVGLAVGAAAGYTLKRLVGSQTLKLEDWQRQFGEQLYGVSATDPLTFGAIAVLLALAALAACYLPARRAAKVDPLVALRHE